MVEDSAARLDSVFHALSDRTRRAMLGAVAKGEHSIGELAAPHAMSFAAASKHVRVLEEAGLLSREVHGRKHVCRLRAEPLGEAAFFLAAYAAFWSERFDALERVLNEQAQLEARRPRAKRPHRTRALTRRKPRASRRP